MTRYRDLMCEDIFGCNHEPETPVIDNDNNIVEWICRCGDRRHPVKKVIVSPPSESE